MLRTQESPASNHGKPGSILVQRGDSYGGKKLILTTADIRATASVDKELGEKHSAGATLGKKRSEEEEVSFQTELEPAGHEPSVCRDHYDNEKSSKPLGGIISPGTSPCVNLLWSSFQGP